MGLLYNNLSVPVYLILIALAAVAVCVFTLNKGLIYYRDVGKMCIELCSTVDVAHVLLREGKVSWHKEQNK